MGIDVCLRADSRDVSGRCEAKWSCIDECQRADSRDLSGRCELEFEDKRVPGVKRVQNFDSSGCEQDTKRMCLVVDASWK